MRNLIHVTGWTKPGGQVATAVLFPSTEARVFPTARTWLATQKRYFWSNSFLTIIDEPATYVKTTLSSLVGVDLCPICLHHAIPCWDWRRVGLPTLCGSWAQEPMQTPSLGEQEAVLAGFSGNPNALSQLRGGSPMLESVLREVTFPSHHPGRLTPQPQIRQVRRMTPQELEAEILETSLPGFTPTRQAPTPAGTIRCTTCHQVIPPGFEKSKDTKKTVDEVYAECEHAFDEKTKICSKCNLPQRNTNRFSWLEVD